MYLLSTFFQKFAPILFYLGGFLPKCTPKPGTSLNPLTVARPCSNFRNARPGHTHPVATLISCPVISTPSTTPTYPRHAPAQPGAAISSTELTSRADFTGQNTSHHSPPPAIVGFLRLGMGHHAEQGTTNSRPNFGQVRFIVKKIA